MNINIKAIFFWCAVFSILLGDWEFLAVIILVFIIFLLVSDCKGGSMSASSRSHKHRRGRR